MLDQHKTGWSRRFKVAVINAQIIILQTLA
jgi:hypothetical protein